MVSGLGLLQRVPQRLRQLARPVVAGQPTAQTHPHLLQEGQLAPGVAADEFVERRRRLASILPSSSLAVLPSAGVKYVEGVVPYPYRQDADFRYLTGITTPGSVAVVSAGPDPHFTLFVPNQDENKQRWDGSTLDCNAAHEVFKADAAYPMSELRGRLQTMMAGSGTIMHDPDCSGGALAAAVPMLQLAVQQRKTHPLRPFLHELRWTKSPAEVQLMRQSAGFAAAAIAKCMSDTRPGVAEHQLAATFEFECRVRGAEGMAYPPIVAAGPDACTIHYSRADKVIEEGQLLKMDAGCVWHGYCSDVTRTWPVGGRFSAAQRTLYEIVQDIHRRCLEECRPGARLAAIHQLSVKLVQEGLASIGIRTTSGLFPGSHSYMSYYPHSVGHWLGLDVHDCPNVPRTRPLQPGVLLSIEPGLYIPDDPQRYGAYAGTGIRIEDVVLITEQGAEVLSGALPTKAEDVEHLVNQ